MIKDGSMVRYASIFAEKYGTLVRYTFFVMVRVRYVATVRLICNGTGRASERNFSRGYEDRCRAPKTKCHLPMNQKRPSLKFRPIFCPKLGEEQKKRSSLKFGPIFCPKLGEEQTK